MSAPVENRVTYDEAGHLDEIVTDGGAHLECLGGGKRRARWFLNCIRADGSEICVWLEGRVTLIEERPAPRGAGESER